MPTSRLIPNRALIHSRAMRRAPTAAERALWMRLRDRAVLGFKFRRQHVVGDYIADFCCVERKLIVELDGEQHALERRRYDQKRSADLRLLGYRVLRFWNHEAIENLDGVVEAIAIALGQHTG